MRSVIVGHIVAIAQQPAFDPFDQVRATCTHIQISPGLEQKIPQRHPDIGAIDINLEPTLFGVTRPGNRQIQAFKLKQVETEEPDITHPLTKDPFHKVFGLGTLYGQR